MAARPLFGASADAGAGSTTRRSATALLGERRARPSCLARASPRIRTRRCCTTISRWCSSARATTTRRARRRSAACTRTRAAQLHKNIGDPHYRAGRYDEALESLPARREVQPELGSDMYLKLGNIRLKPAGARRRGALLGARARARSGQRHRPHESRSGSAGLLMLDQQHLATTLSSS